MAETNKSTTKAKATKTKKAAPAEAEVAVRVLRGHGLPSVAGELRVSLSTVRTHLQRVFQKTGAHRQAELVRLLMELEASLTLIK